MWGDPQRTVRVKVDKMLAALGEKPITITYEDFGRLWVAISIGMASLRGVMRFAMAIRQFGCTLVSMSKRRYFL
jgi:hypothetical protein